MAQLQAHRLIDRLHSYIPTLTSRVAAIRKNKTPVDTLRVQHILTGLRGAKVLSSFTTNLDPEKGHFIRERSLEDLISQLPRLNEALCPESLFWYMIANEMPNAEQIDDFIKEEYFRSELPSHTVNMLQHMPKEIPASVMLSMLVLSLETQSKFGKAYGKVPRNKLWESAYEDTINIISKYPLLLNLIYAKKHSVATAQIPTADIGKAAAYAIHITDQTNVDAIRLFMTLYMDSNSGSVSSHVSKAVGSTLSTPFKATSAALNGIGGPLHGRALEDSLKMLLESKGNLTETVTQRFEQGINVPGFGHAVLKHDPRYYIMRDYWIKKGKHQDLLENIERAVHDSSKVLSGKLRSPIPNADLMGGAFLYSFGVKEVEMITALMGISRTIGSLTNYVLDRACELPIEYAMSVDLADIKEIVSKAIGKTI